MSVVRVSMPTNAISVSRCVGTYSTLTRTISHRDRCTDADSIVLYAFLLRDIRFEVRYLIFH